MDREEILDTLTEHDYENSFKIVNCSYNKQLTENLSKSTNCVIYQDQVLLYENIKAIIVNFGKLTSIIVNNSNESKKNVSCYTDQCTNTCLKISKYIDESKDIDYLIQKTKNINIQNENSNDQLDLNLYENPENTNDNIRYIINESIKICARNEENLINDIKTKQQNIESLNSKIENAKLRLFKVNQLSQLFEESNLDDEDETITEDDIINTKAVLEKLESIGEERSRLLEDLCVKVNVKVDDIDKILSQPNNFNNQTEIITNSDSEVEDITSEIIQLLSMKINDIKKENEISRKLLIDKKKEQDDLERRYKKVLDEMELFTF
ncbi:Hypothetical protein SRAE_1000154500 [Strongyloides ratti]|uniref:Uncharacterized protein n=1 Tax=Strongyloides ratti TaxID=34506 RepID=A0A090L5B3_STRRB|nr:Hypothetical protein SRAE_1000154500 [Strongyloides ratti]CEF63282.2 Hypothetical protein SRAE_1000154500 [Strongyloides ratti]